MRRRSASVATQNVNQEIKNLGKLMRLTSSADRRNELKRLSRQGMLVGFNPAKSYNGGRERGVGVTESEHPWLRSTQGGISLVLAYALCAFLTA